MADAEELALEREKLEVDRQLRASDLDLQREELKLKQIELRRGRWSNPLTVGVFVAAVGLIGNFFVAAYQARGILEATREKAKQDLSLEKDKARSDLIFQAVKAPPDQATTNLRFLISARILDDPSSEIESALTGGFRPSSTQAAASNKADAAGNVTDKPQQILKIYSSPPQVSGSGSNFSSQYVLCSEPLAGYHINSAAFALSGDRSCGAYSTCKELRRTNTEVCWAYTMQGHSELPPPGQAISQGTLQVVWAKD